MGLTEWIERVAEAFDVVGAAILVVGFLWSVAIAMRAWRATDGDAAYRSMRTTFGGALLLGLEVLVAAPVPREANPLYDPAAKR